MSYVDKDKPPPNSSKRRIKLWFKFRAAREAHVYMYGLGLKPPNFPVPTTRSS